LTLPNQLNYLNQLLLQLMLSFESQTVSAHFIDPDGKSASRDIEIRTDPVTGRTCRISLSRRDENEPGSDTLPDPPPDAPDRDSCPFCRPHLSNRTPRLNPDLSTAERRTVGRSVLFPNPEILPGYQPQRVQPGPALDGISHKPRGTSNPDGGPIQLRPLGAQ
jgi:hypothetical protein